MRWLVSIVVFMIISAAAPGLLHAETVALKDGRSLQGKVIIKGQTVTILVGPRIYQFRKDQIAVFGGKKAAETGKSAKSAAGKKTAPAKTADTATQQKSGAAKKPAKK